MKTPDHGHRRIRIQIAFLTIAILIGLAAAPRAGLGLELGLTPDDVFGLWTNINRALIAYARNLSDDDEWLGKLAQMTPRKFDGMAPEDVLAGAKQFGEKLQTLAVGAPGANEESVIETELLFLFGEDSAGVTPSLVFLHSERLLVEAVRAAVAASGGKQLVSPFFAAHDFKDKVPSDVFALVDLARRRLDELLLGQRQGHLARRGADQ